MRGVVLGAALVAGLFACSGSRERSDSASDAIMNGVKDTTHPAVMYVVNFSAGPNGDHCTGTLVGLHNGYGYVLTAAHCIGCNASNVMPPTTFIQVVQGDDASATSAVHYSVGAGVCDPEFSTAYPAADHDFGVLQIYTQGTSPPAPMPMLDAAHDKIGIGTPIEIVGYGLTQSSQVSIRNRVDNVVSYTDTSGNIGYSEAPPRGGACFGDSGGPVLVTIGGTQYVAGVTSNVIGSACNDRAFAGRVSTVLASFIEPFISAPIVVDTCTTPKPTRGCSVRGGWRCCGADTGWVCGVCS